MTKTQEELIQLKTEYETLNNKLKELTKDELKIVIGGVNAHVREKLPDCPFSDIERYEQEYEKCIYKDQYEQCEQCSISKPKSKYKTVSVLPITHKDW